MLQLSSLQSSPTVGYPPPPPRPVPPCHYGSSSLFVSEVGIDRLTYSLKLYEDISNKSYIKVITKRHRLIAQTSNDRFFDARVRACSRVFGEYNFIF